MIWFSYALMHISVWVCTTIAAIYFNSPILMWVAVAGAISLPSFRTSDKSDVDKKSYESDEQNVKNMLDLDK